MNISRFIHVAVLVAVFLPGDTKIEILGKDSDGNLEDAIGTNAYGWIFEDAITPFVLQCREVGTLESDVVYWVNSAGSEVGDNTQLHDGTYVYVEHTFLYSEAGALRCKHTNDNSIEVEQSYTIYAAAINAEPATVEALVGAAATLTCSFDSQDLAGASLEKAWSPSWVKPSNGNKWTTGNPELSPGKLVTTCYTDDASSTDYAGSFTCSWVLSSNSWYTNDNNPSVTVEFSVPNLEITYTPNYAIIGGPPITFTCTCTAETEAICDTVSMSPDSDPPSVWAEKKMTYTATTTVTTEHIVTCSSTEPDYGLSASVTVPFALSLKIDTDDLYTTYYVAQDQEYKLPCKLTGFTDGYDFVGNAGDLPKLVMGKGDEGAIENVKQEVTVNTIQILVPVDTGTADDTEYSCKLESPYASTSPKIITVKTIGLVQDLESLYILKEGEIDLLTVKIQSVMTIEPTIIWNESGSTLTMIEDNSGPGYTSGKEFGATDSPVSATVNYASSRANNEMIIDGFSISSTTAIIKELIIRTPSTKIPTGGKVVITCSIKATKVEHLIGIYKADTRLVTGDRVTVHDRVMNGDETSVLRTAEITDAETSDGATYKCGINNIDGYLQESDTLDITVGTFEAAATNGYWLEGVTKSAKLMCTVEASLESDYTIDWYKDVNKLSDNNDGFSISTGINSDTAPSLLYSSLHKSSVVVADVAKYECRIGEVVREITVEVVGVTLTKNKVYLTKESWDSTGVVCSVKAPDGNKFNVVWKNSEGEVVSGSSAGYQTPNMENELKVTGEPPGEFQCTVSHSDVTLGSTAEGVTETATVYLLEPGADSEQYYITGTSLELTCSYKLTPADVSVTVNYQFKDSANKELQSSELDTYPLSSPVDVTTTTCVVTMETLSVTMIIVAKPRVVGVTEDGARYIYAGSQAKVTCHLTALDSEVAEFTPMWTKGSDPIDTSKYTIFSATAADETLESVLTLPDVTQETTTGLYKCKLASLDTAASTDLKVQEVIEPVDANLVKFWSGTDKVTIQYEVEEPPGDVVPFVVSGGAANEMTCDNSKCTYSSDLTRTDSNPAVRNVGAQIRLRGDVALGGETISGNILVKIYTRMLSGMEEKVFITGETVKFTCEVVAEETAEIKWMKDTEDLTVSAVVEEYDTENKCRISTLAVKVVDNEDLMKYTCSVPSDSNLGELKLSDIRVPGPVSIGVAEQTVEDVLMVNEGSPLTITCSATVSDDDVVTTATLMEWGHEATGFNLDDSSTREMKKFTVEEITFSQDGNYKCSMKYSYSGSEATSLSDGLTITVTEWESSTDYMDIAVGTTLSVSFSGTVDTNSVYWQDEETNDKYTVATNPGDNKISAANIVVTEVGDTTTITIPPGAITSTTSFKVKAAVGGKEEIKRKRIQVYEPVITSKVLFDNDTIHSSQGFIEIPVSEYSGVPTVTTEPESYFDVTNVHGNKIQVLVWPKNIEKENLAVKITIVLSAQSTSVNTITFSKVGIKTEPAISDKEDKDERIVFYKKDMNDKEKAATAISCTFEATVMVATVLGSRIEGDGSIKKTNGEGVKTITLSHNELSEPAKGEPDSYTCVFVVEYHASSREYTRKFKVQLKTSKTNAGAIAAAVIIAVLIIAIIVSFFVYRSRRNRASNQAKIKTPSSPNHLVQETELSGPENHPKFNDAVYFLDKIQIRFEGQPDIYQTFLNTLTDFRSKKIVRADLVRKVGILFEGHPDLIEGFGNFLSSKKRAASDNQYTAIDLQGNSGGEIHVNPVAEKRV